MMPVSVKQCNEMKLAGLMMPMSLLANRTQMLWRQFMQRRKELGSVVSEKLISLISTLDVCSRSGLCKK
jgi:hypothetical protein